MAAKTGIPMVYDLADDLPAMVALSPSVPRLLRPLGSLLGNRLVRQTIRRSRMVTATTTAFQQQYQILQERFTHLPNGVDTTIFRPVPSTLREQLGLLNAFVLGYVGVLREWVDFGPVFHALRDLERAHLLLVGEEGGMSAMARLAKSLGVENRVTFCGTVPHRKVPEYIAAMDACLIPFDRNRIAHSAVPLKLFEYMACGKPVISTRIRGVRETAGDRVLYADTSDELLHCIRRLDEGDWESGSEGRSFVLAHHDWEPIARRLERILEEVA